MTIFQHGKEREMNLETINGLVLLKLENIIGNKKKGIEPLIPIGRAAWSRGVESGMFPKPKRLGPRTHVWKASDIINLLNKLN